MSSDYLLNIFGTHSSCLLIKYLAGLLIGLLIDLLADELKLGRAKRLKDSIEELEDWKNWSLS